MGRVSLRDAIAVAMPGDTINFAPSLTASGPATLLLTRGEIAFGKNLTIVGPGCNLLTIDASGSDQTPGFGDGTRIFNFSDGNSLSDKILSVSGVRLTGGDSYRGGAIETDENLTVADSIITGNRALNDGGGIFSYGGALNVINCTLSENWTGYSGGAIRKTRGTGTINNCVIVGNRAAESGGGIASQFCENLTIRDTVFNENRNLRAGAILCRGRNLTMINCSVIDNGNDDGNGAALDIGGYDNDFRNGFQIVNLAVSIDSCLISANSSGGIRFSRGTLSINKSNISGNEKTGIEISYYGDSAITNSTISGNSFRGIRAKTNGSFLLQNCTISGNTSGDRGGGVFLESTGLGAALASILNCTITGNSAHVPGSGSGYAAGGGVYGSFTLENTIIAGNYRDFITKDDFSGGAIAKYCLVGAYGGAGILDIAGCQLGTPSAPIDARLGPLVDNGGPTFLDGSRQVTHMPLPDSSAINGGDPAVAGEPGGYDERGGNWVRVSGGRLDIGAVEVQPNLLAGDYNFNGVVDSADYVLWRKLVNSATDLRADGNGNGVVDSADYDFWRSRIGNSRGLGAALAANLTTSSAVTPDGISSALASHLPPAAEAETLISTDLQVTRSAPAPTTPPLRNHEAGLVTTTTSIHPDSTLIAWLESQVNSANDQSDIAAQATEHEPTMSHADCSDLGELDQAFALLAITL